MRRLTRHITAIAATVTALTVTSCLKNDIPYPRIQPDITAIAAEGEVSPAVIDTDNRTVTLSMDEETDLASVTITELTLSEGATLVTDIDTGSVDLTSPLQLTLRLYQDYVWTITARQDIERYFEVDGQIGETVIDVPACRVVVTLSSTSDLTQSRVIRAKLGPVGSTMNPDIVDGEYIDLSRPFETVVTVHGAEQLWTIYADISESTVTTTAADAWSEVAWVYANVLDTTTGGFEYRRHGDSEWTRVAAADITYGSGTMMACIKHLTPQTTYEVRAYDSTQAANTITVTTGGTPQLPNSNFEDWWLNGKVWNPWAEGGVQYWDTGNIGASTLGTGNVEPSDDTPTGTGRSAKLSTQWKVVKLAAGSIFTGKYVATDGTDGILSFGRDFTDRPTAVRGWFKYDCKIIDRAPINSELASVKGQPDTCIVWCALIDTPVPYEIRTKPSNRHLFDPAGPEVVAYGKVQRGESVPGWTQFEFKLNYVNTNRVPRYIIMVAASSIYGDYYVGGVGSTLWVDDLELLYDYN